MRLNAVITWWLRTMRDMLPLKGGSLPRRHGGAVLVAVGEDARGTHIDIQAPEQRRQAPRRIVVPSATEALPALRTALAGLRGGRREAVLRLGPEDLLERSVDLPLAAEHAVEGALRFEIDRLTPFGATDALWTWAPLARDAAAGRLVLRLSVLSARRVRPWLDHLAQAGLAVVAVEAETPSGDHRVFPLGSPTVAAGRRKQRRARQILAAACAALAMLAVGLPFLRQSIALAGVETELAELRPRMAEVDALRGRLALANAGADVVAQTRARAGEPLQLLAAVTELLPDHTVLSELVIGDGTILLRGHSAAAAPLIAAFASDPLFRDPAFAAPVRRSEAGSGESFSLRAALGH